MANKKGKIAIIVHGGAGPDSHRIEETQDEIKKGLKDAVKAGYKVLEEGGTAVDAVEAAVRSLEDNPLFNAGRGSAINAKAEVEMCSSIMDGSNRDSGACAIVQNVKNPVSLAKAIMLNTDFLYLGGPGALDYAQKINIALEPDSYFITEHQYDAYAKKREQEFESTAATAHEQIKKRKNTGTVGAVALDEKGNIAAATSTGGTENSKEGRIGDSSMVGVGCYADNRTCAVSTTGDGEFLMKNVIAYNISAAVEYKELTPQEAVDYVIHERNKDTEGDMGVICLDAEGNLGITFNSERMHRAWKTSDGDEGAAVYPED
jgi:beta-aspartyl-peptidase (threonine type)